MLRVPSMGSERSITVDLVVRWRADEPPRYVEQERLMNPGVRSRVLDPQGALAAWLHFRMPTGRAGRADFGAAGPLLHAAGALPGPALDAFAQRRLERLGA